MSSTLAVFARLPVGDRREEVLAAIGAYGAHVRAQPGTLTFDVYVPTDDEPSVFVWEVYRDHAAFDEHLADPENTRFNATLHALTGAGSQVVVLSPVAPGETRQAVMP